MSKYTLEAIYNCKNCGYRYRMLMQTKHQNSIIDMFKKIDKELKYGNVKCPVCNSVLVVNIDLHFIET